MLLIPSDSTLNTLSYPVKAEVARSVPGLWPIDFGRYDIFPTDSSRLFFDFEEGGAQSVQLLSAGNVGAPMPFSPWMDTLFFLLFLFSFMLFAFIFRWEGAALKGNFKSILTFGKQTPFIHKNQVTKTEAWGELYLLFQTMLIFSLLIFSWLWGKGVPVSLMGEQSLGFIGIFVGFSLLLYLKIMGYRLIGTFFLEHEMKGWITFYTRMMEILGIIFFLPVVFYVYLHEFRNSILICLVALFLISRLVIYIGLLNIFVKNKIGLFYFFVYLCAIEIAPYLLLYKGVLFAITIAEDNII